MANAAVTSNTKRIYDKTLSHLALSYDKGPQDLMKICLAVGYGPRAVSTALEKLASLKLAERTGSLWRLSYSIWDYRRKHFWKGESFEHYLKRPADKMPVFKRMRLTCDMLGCVIGFFQLRRPDEPAPTVPEALAVMRDMDWKQLKYAHGTLPPAAETAPGLDHPASRQIIKRMGDLCKDLKDPRKVARCVELQRFHALGTQRAYEYMKSVDSDYNYHRLKGYMTFCK